MTTGVIEQEIQHIHDLLSLRHLLADRGVAAEELLRCDAAIAAAYTRLAAIERADAAEFAA
jgi:hypothetical protein